MPVVVIVFGQLDRKDGWHTVDDVVMGGRSDSRLEFTAEGTAVFAGTLSLDGGGFASVHGPIGDGAIVGSTALVLRFRGDGKRYKLRLRTSGAFDRVSYEAPFDTTAGEWTERAFPITDFAPVWRGRQVSDAPGLRLEAVQGVGVLISDEQEGSFRLELDTLARS